MTSHIGFVDYSFGDSSLCFCAAMLVFWRHLAMKVEHGNWTNC